MTDDELAAIEARMVRGVDRAETTVCGEDFAETPFVILSAADADTLLAEVRRLNRVDAHAQRLDEWVAQMPVDVPPTVSTGGAYIRQLIASAFADASHPTKGIRLLNVPEEATAKEGELTVHPDGSITNPDGTRFPGEWTSWDDKRE